MGFSRQEDWSGLPFPSPGDLPNPRVEARSPALQADSLPSEPPGKPQLITSQILGYCLLVFSVMGVISLIFQPLFTAISTPDYYSWDLCFAGVETEAQSDLSCLAGMVSCRVRIGLMLELVFFSPPWQELGDLLPPQFIGEITEGFASG